MDKYLRSQCKRKYQIDETIFEKIDTEFKAYFLGWMFSDGNVYIKSRRHTLSITLSETDKEILDVFNKIIYNNKKKLNYRPARDKITHKKIYKCKPCYRLQIDSKKMCEDIQKIGCVPDKSQIIEFPTSSIPKNLIRHFIRGYFDGDGCITYNRKKWGSFMIFSSKIFCVALSDFFLHELDITSSIHKGDGRWNIKITDRFSIQKIFNFFYTDCHFKLKRKFDKFKEIVDNLSHIPPKTSKHKNIHYSKDKRWIVQKCINKKHIHIGSYTTEEQALLALNEFNKSF